MLTEDEYSIMKTLTNIGTETLSIVSKPYPQNILFKVGMITARFLFDPEIVNAFNEIPGEFKDIGR